MSSIKTMMLVSITIILSVLISCWAARTQNKIYSVDLGRITKTQMMIAGRMAASGINKATWMMTIKDTSLHIRQSIQKIAGNHMVIVTPAVIQGSIDITDQVLKFLNLPTNLPIKTLSQSDVIPSLIPQETQTDAVVSNKEKQKTNWLLP